MAWQRGIGATRLPAQGIGCRYGRVFDALLDHGSEGYETAIHLIGMYAVDRQEVLEGLRPQLVKAADNLVRQIPPSTMFDLTMLAHHFRTLMTWLLERGRDNADARSAAMSLSSSLIGEGGGVLDTMMEDVVRPLLGEIAEISWQILGAAVLSKEIASLNLRFLLGRALSDERSDPPILCLPEEVLFAWCRAHGDEAAAFAAETLPFQDREGNGGMPHPLMQRLLREFGDRPKVQAALSSNLHSGAFWGSPSSFFSRHNEALSNLAADPHLSRSARRWARETLQELMMAGEAGDRRSDEWKAKNES